MLTPEHFNQRSVHFFPGHVGVVVTHVGPKELRAELQIRQALMAPNGYLHAGTVVAMADTCCGYGCLASLPEGMTGFTTSELKSNFIRSTGPEDALRCEARLQHAGRTTQVWDAAVTRESDGKVLALFRCSQYLLAQGR